jgi:hypothetical protein
MLEPGSKRKMKTMEYENGHALPLQTTGLSLEVSAVSAIAAVLLTFSVPERHLLD